LKIEKLPHDLIPRLSLEEVKVSKRHKVIVLVHNVRSLYNVGAIFRTADAAAVEKIYLCGYTGTPPRKEIDKTALGSTESVPWEYVADIKEVIKKLKTDGYQIAALEITTNSKRVSDLTAADFPLAFIIGNEITGVDNDVLELCNFSLEIPQFGIKQSINVAVAFGIGIYGVIDQYRKFTPENELPQTPKEPSLTGNGDPDID